jgi:hypothetical protein
LPKLEEKKRKGADSFHTKVTESSTGVDDDLDRGREMEGG